MFQGDLCAHAAGEASIFITASTGEEEASKAERGSRARRRRRREMGGDPGKVIRNMKGAAQKYLGVGFLLGFFLVLLTYFTVSEQFAITAPNGESESVLLCSSPSNCSGMMGFV